MTPFETFLKWLMRVGLVILLVSLYFFMKTIEDAGSYEAVKEGDLAVPIAGLFHGIFFTFLGWLFKKVMARKGKIEDQFADMIESSKARKAAMYETSEVETIEAINYLKEDDFSKVMDELRKNKTINAIKLVRGYTGLGLKEAKDVVEHLKSNGTRDYEPTEDERPKKKFFNNSEPVAKIVSEMDETVQDLIISEIRTGQSINAIKVTRDVLGCSLKKAKEIVDFLEKQ